MVSEEHADKKWFQQAMFIYEQELPERIDGPIDFFELVKAAVTSGLPKHTVYVAITNKTANVVQIAHAVLHIDCPKF